MIGGLSPAWRGITCGICADRPGGSRIAQVNRTRLVFITRLFAFRSWGVIAERIHDTLQRIVHVVKTHRPTRSSDGPHPTCARTVRSRAGRPHGRQRVPALKRRLGGTACRSVLKDASTPSFRTDRAAPSGGFSLRIALGRAAAQAPRLKLQGPTLTLQEPTLTLQEPSLTLQEPSLTLQEPILTLQEPSLTLQRPSLTLQEPSLTLQEPSLTLQASRLTLQEPSLTLQEPPLTLQASRITLQDRWLTLGSRCPTLRRAASSAQARRLLWGVRT